MPDPKYPPIITEDKPGPWSRFTIVFVILAVAGVWTYQALPQLTLPKNEVLWEWVARLFPDIIPPRQTTPPVTPHVQLTVDLSFLVGEWRGEYVQHQAVPFQLWFTQAGDQLSGTVREPNTLNSLPGKKTAPDPAVPELTATVSDVSFNGNLVRFQKHYNGEGGYHQVVYYEGVFDPDHKTMAGRWAVGQSAGPFTMYLIRPQ